MTISARTRKLLWGRSGNRCAMCRRELIEPGTPVDDESIIGDECHIEFASSGGPRHNPESAQEKLDDYGNLLLLCKVHHKLIDDQTSEYSVSHLVEIKVRHEKWVSEQLEALGSEKRPLRIRRVEKDGPAFLSRIRSGKELLHIVTDACEFAPQYDELRGRKEDELVAGFLQEAQDLGKLGLDSVSDMMLASRSLDDDIEEFERAGFWVFGYREHFILEGAVGPDNDWPVAHVRVLRNTNPEIIVTENPTNQDKSGK